MYREFAVPDDEEIFSVIGEWPAMDENATRTLTWRQNEGDSLILSYNLSPGRSGRDGQAATVTNCWTCTARALLD
jgi:hypothetical protein